MLQRLKIRNLAVIEELDIEFDRGLNLFTGETGAGKSIIIDALILLLGGRADIDLIRTGTDQLSVEGLFTVRNPGEIPALLRSAGIESDDNKILIKREIKKDGRNRSLVNGCFSTSKLLKEIGNLLVEIHGQHQQQRLLDRTSHILVLDLFAGISSERESIEKLFYEMEFTRKQLDAIRQDSRIKAQKIDILNFQINELKEARLEPGDEEKLEQERSILSNADLLFRNASEAYIQLYEAEQSIIARLEAVKKNLSKISNIDASFDEDHAFIESAVYGLQDIAYKLQDFSQKAAPDANRLESVEARLALINRLKKKYGSTISDMLIFLENAEKELEELSTSEEREAELQGKLNSLQQEFIKQSLSISSRRKDAAGRFKNEVERQLRILAMDRTTFDVMIRDARSETIVSIDGDSYRAIPYGIDDIEFYIAPNVGEELKPMIKIASGGELSRIMLALESALNDDKTDRAIIFDEVDVGIGGRVAEIVGKKLRILSYNHQIICVTHLPQVAACATTHFNIFKNVKFNRTYTEVKKLAGDERVREIARMLGGLNITETTLQQAREFLQKA